MEFDLRKEKLDKLVVQLQEQTKIKKDFLVPSSKMKSVNGIIHIDDVRDSNVDNVLEGTGVGSDSYILKLKPFQSANVQIADKLGIPFRYYDKLYNDHHKLFDQNLNYWFENIDRTYFVRTFEDINGDVGYLRALLSDSYFALENIDVLIAALDTIREMGVNVQVSTCNLTERRMYIRFFCPDVEVQAPELLRNYKVPGGGTITNNYTIYSGFVLSNSETGHGSYSIGPRGVILACDNGLTNKRDYIYKRHLGSKMESEGDAVQWSKETKKKEMDLIVSQVKDAVRTFVIKEYLNGLVRKIIDNSSEELKHPLNTVKNVCVDMKYTQEETQSILDYFVKSGDSSGFGVAQAITYYAHTDANADRQYEMEMDAFDAAQKIKKYDVKGDVKI